jgi:uncharacterized MAPEG superfamily protein
MTIELQMLALSIVLGLVHIILNASTATTQYGLDWNTGPRDAPMPPLTGVAGRLQRAMHNFVESFALFAAAVLIAQAAGRHNALTHWGVQLYFWGRVAYLPLYAFGIPKIRSAAWGIATLGTILILVALL